MLDMHTDMAGSAVALARRWWRWRSSLAAGRRCLARDHREQHRAERLPAAGGGAGGNGTTIQVIHSDAEGRMVLADTLALAARTRPRLIDRFCDPHRRLRARADRTLQRRVHQPAAIRRGAGRRRRRDSGERVWNFPLDEDFDSDLESTVADVMQCSADGKGDHILAARFLQRFVGDDRPWVHVDLSSATRRGGLAHVTTEITGFGVRFDARAAADGRQAAARAHELAGMTQQITLRRPDDWHLHLRDGAALRCRAAVHRRALCARHRDAQSRAAGHDHGAGAGVPRAHPGGAAAPGAHFEPLMTLYLTDHTSAAEIERAHAVRGAIVGCKLYPAGATTHSDAGVTDIARLEPALEAMSAARPAAAGARRGHRPAHRRVRSRGALHRARAGAAVRALAARCASCSSTSPRARRSSSCARRARGVAATVTPQHLLLNRNALFAGGLRPHHYCLPLLKTEPDRRSLLEVLAERQSRASSSAPTARRTRAHAKESGLRLRRHLLGACRHRAVCRDLRVRGHAAAPAGLRLPSMAPTSTAGRATRTRSRWCKQPWTRAGELSVSAPRELVPLRAGEPSAGGCRARAT